MVSKFQGIMWLFFFWIKTMVLVLGVSSVKFKIKKIEKEEMDKMEV